MDWAGRWAKMSEQDQHKERMRISIQGKLRNSASAIKEVAPGEYTVKLGANIEIPNLSKVRAAEIVLEHKYGIKVKISKMQPFTFEVLEGSEPILQQERGRVVVNMSLSEAKAVLTELERTAQYEETGKYTVLIQRLTKNIQATESLSKAETD